jgi:hypothetical protein
MRKRVLLLVALSICSRGVAFGEDQSPFPALLSYCLTNKPDSTVSTSNVQLEEPQAPQSMNAANGGYGVTNPPSINSPLGPPLEATPGIGEAPEPVPTNELVPGGKKNIIEEASQKLWRLIFTVQGGVYYDSNIFITDFNRQDDTVVQLAGGFTFELGDYRALANNFVIIKYLATGYIYTSHSDLNGVNQDFYLTGQYRFGNFTAQSNIAFSYLDGPDRAAGTFTSHYFVDGLFRLLYDVSDKTQLHAEFEQITELYPAQLNSFEYIGRLGIDYSITPKIRLGFEAVIGSLSMEDGGEILYQQGRLRAAYKLTEKLSFLASAGFTVEEFSARTLTKVTPVFDMGLSYAPFVDTTLGLTAFRKVFASPVELGQDFTATGVQINAGQRFFQRITAACAFGYEHDVYGVSGAKATNINRTDDFVYVRPNLTYDMGGWLKAEVYYQFSRNSSSLGGASFSDNRVGMQIIFAF